MPQQHMPHDDEMLGTHPFQEWTLPLPSLLRLYIFWRSHFGTFFYRENPKHGAQFIMVITTAKPSITITIRILHRFYVAVAIKHFKTTPPVCLSTQPAFRARSVSPTVLDEFFPFQAQMITIIRGCILYNDSWLWPISPKPFSHEFAIKLLKYGTSCLPRFTAYTVLDEFFPYLAQIITSMAGCVACNDLWTWTISWYWQNMGHIVVSDLQHVQFWVDSFPHDQ